MIAQFLNRDFVLQQLDRVLQELKTGVPDDRRRADGPPVVSAADYAAAAHELAAAKQREAKMSSGQDGYDMPITDRRGGATTRIDDEVFLSHDPIISLLQSALEQYVVNNKPALISASATELSGRRGQSDENLITDLSLNVVSSTVDPGTGRRLFGPFEETDPGWVASLVAEGVRLIRKKRPFNSRPADPVRIADNARLLLVGDWGSGLPRAQKVARQMRAILDQGKAANLEQHVIHLGDVYYSGWEYEYTSRFLPYWPVRPEEANTISSWCLNGNHDMYSGGWAYYDVLLKDPRFARQQQSSFFSFFNSGWQVLGLDTAYDDGGLKDPQADWLAEMLKKGNRRSMLLSHHQLFSAYEGPSKELAKKIKPVLDQPEGIDCWFWGHEHRCVFYREHSNVRHARLIGHGGVPVYMPHKLDDAYPPPAYYECRNYVSKMFGLEHFAMFGFAVVDFRGSQAHVRYIDENGYTHADEIIPKSPRWQGSTTTTIVSAPPMMDIPVRRSPSPVDEGRRGIELEPSPSSRGIGGHGLLTRVDNDAPKGYSPAPYPEWSGTTRRIYDYDAGFGVVRRTPHMDISSRGSVRPNEEFTVSVYTDKSIARKGEEVSEDITVPIIPGVNNYKVQVWLTVSDHFVVLENRPTKTFTISANQTKSRAVKFKLRASSSFHSLYGATINAIFDYKGRSSGRVTRIIPLANADSATQVASPSGLLREAGVGVDASAPKIAMRSVESAPLRSVSGHTPMPRLVVDDQAAELDLTIKINNPNNDLMTFDCHVRTPLLAAYKDGVTCKWHTNQKTSDILEAYFEAFTQSVDNDQRLDRLKGAGKQLFDVAPSQFKQIFWDLIDAGKPPKTISIMSDEPYIPWELMIPWRIRAGGAREIRPGPLGSEFSVGRWLSRDYLLPTQSVKLSDSLIFAPQYSNPPGVLPNSAAEAALVSGFFLPSKSIRPAVYLEFKQALKAGGATLLHFVCHGADSTANMQRIYVEGNGTTAFMTSLDIDGMEECAAAFAKTKPLVFLNACQIGNPTAALIGVGGFAKSFIDAGASCVIAPLWSVKDSIAHQVASMFYNTVKNNKDRPFADIIRAIRQQTYTGLTQGEDTYAAYSFYGDPLAMRA